MPKQLVIVESPTKARTIARFLGADFVVDSSYGHIRDLPTSKLGVDVEHDFAPQYVIPRRANPVVKRLRAAAKNAQRIILATDEDREGEAIAWHLAQALDLDKESSPPVAPMPPTKKSARATKTKRAKLPPTTARIVFHEITQKAILEALKNPRAIDQHLVDAQQARRILDRLVGYKLSPFLWKKIYRGLSAGRVQSVAVRFVADREREINKFKKEEYWTIEADLAREESAPADQEIFPALLVKKNDETLGKFSLPIEDAAATVVSALADATWRVAKVDQRAISRKPLPPYTTSTLQQDAFRRLGFSARQTMTVAQQLYEGMELGSEAATGLITYMRTDSLNVSGDAIAAVREHIKNFFGPSYVAPRVRRFKTNAKGAQEAHEAIRPTDPARTPESIQQFLDRRQYRLYDLVWRRFTATQMPDALFDATMIEIIATSPSPASADHYTFRATGQIARFDGFLKIYPMRFTETSLPGLRPEEALRLIQLKPAQHFTEPPPRYTEASLIKTLEQNGIGRPSTYAPTLATIQDRRYVERDERKRLVPTETGFLVNDMLVEHFPEIVDVQFTAKMEEELDAIAQGTLRWQPVIREFYEPFAQHLEIKYTQVQKHEIAETTEEVCEKCGKPMVVKLGRFGKFLACSGFPECKSTKAIKQQLQTIGMHCPTCGTGEVIRRFTKRKRMFYGCSRYPDCDYASWNDPRTPSTKKSEKPTNPND